MYKNILSFFALSLSFCIASAQYSYTVTTVAGDSAGYKDGANSIALFSAPTGIAADAAGNLYVADAGNNIIRKEWLGIGLVGTFAGNDTAGYRDGAASQAEFNYPAGVCVDKYGNVYVADMYNNRIRKITPLGVVSTYAGNGKSGLRNGVADSAEFYLPTGVAVDTLGNLYVADNGNYCIRKISTTDSVTTLAGTGFAGFNNGAGDVAQFNGLYGITVNYSGTIYISEYINNDIRRIENGAVSVFAGFASQPSPPGIKDGPSDSAYFNNPMGLAIDSVGDLIVCDEFNNRIRKIRHDTVSTLAGTGATGSHDTVAYQATFNSPYDITSIRATFYVADNGNNRIRAIVPPPPLGVMPIADKENNLFVYPNPCNDYLVVASAPAGQATLLDVTGREVWTNEHFKSPSVISISGLAPGIYFLRISGEQGLATRKIVIQR